MKSMFQSIINANKSQLNLKLVYLRNFPNRHGKHIYFSSKAESFPKKNIDKMHKHLFDGSHTNVYNRKAVINIGLGAPGPDILTNCCAIMEKATSHRMKIEAANLGLLFQYGPAVGVIEARLGIAKLLTESYRSEVKSEDIIITTGATHGMHVILSTLVDLNGYIFVDEVTYMDAPDGFRQLTTLQMIPIKLNDDGVDIEAFRAILKEKQFKSKSKSYWGIYYAIPTYHNPTGIVFSDDVCKELICLAREFDILVACDDVYNTLYYKDDEVPKRLYKYDNPNDDDFKGNIISNGSFSKIIAPGLRLGWFEASPRCKIILEDCGLLQGGGSLNNYTSGIMASMLELGLAQKHAKYAKEQYKSRMQAVIEILKNNLPSSCCFAEPKGGFFIWIRLPEYFDANELLKISMEKYKVFFLPGDRFSIEKTHKNYFRISIAFHKKEVLEDAVLKVCASLREYLQNK